MLKVSIQLHIYKKLQFIYNFMRILDAKLSSHCQLKSHFGHAFLALNFSRLCFISNLYNTIRGLIPWNLDRATSMELKSAVGSILNGQRKHQRSHSAAF